MSNTSRIPPLKIRFSPKVSVVIPVYNGETDLPDLIKALESQSYPCDHIEYLLINNNSCDRTEEILNLAAANSIKNQGIKLLVLTENAIQSSYAARNQGIKASKGDIVIFTDADCRPLSNWIEEMVTPFVDPKVGIVVGELVALPGDSLLERYAEQYGVMSQEYLLEHPFLPYGQTANLAIRKEALQQAGLFRPFLTTGGDADICWRIQADSDWKLTFAAKAIVQHRHRSTFKALHSQWRRYGESNSYLHELHGVDLMRNFTINEVFYRISRWLLKETPLNILNVLLKKGNLLDLIKMPIDLFCFQARSVGQSSAKLPQKAKEIDWLDPA